MKERVRRAMCIISLLGVVAGFGYKTVDVQGAENDTVKCEEVVLMNEVQFAFIDTNNTATTLASSSAANGVINGDGVRLRKTASSTAKVLELMYDGELVVIKNRTNASWDYVKRCKTGTLGYVNKKYVYSLD